MCNLKTKILLSLGALVLSITANAAGLSKDQKRQKLAEALATISEAGAVAFGPRDMALSRIVIYDFNGSDVGVRASDGGLLCTFSAYNSERKLQSFEFGGDKCKSTVSNLYAAGLGVSEDAAFVSYISCMIGSGIFTCSVSQPYLK